jgi:hypothetical protein
MENYDIQININVSADSEEEAENKVTTMMRQEMDKPALQRAINSWDFIEWLEEDPDESSISI